MKKVKGAYSVITMINQVGLFAFRDPNGIRPLVIGQRKALSDEEKDEWCIASEAGSSTCHSRIRSVVHVSRIRVFSRPYTCRSLEYTLGRPRCRSLVYSLGLKRRG